jgi:acetyl esterase/lipase
MVRHGSSPMFKVPEAVVDVRKALAHIRANAAEWSVDPARLGVFGGSAGGHLSLMLGAASESAVGKDGDAGENRVAAVVAYFPPVDLQPIVGPNDRFPALDFDPELGDDISPLLYVSSDDPPTLLVHGTADTLVPQSTSETIYAAFQEKGVASKLVIIEGAGHGFQGEHEAQASAELIAWFEHYLAPPTGAGTAGTEATSHD